LEVIDYIDDNLSESFNSWMSKTKDMHVVDMLENIRNMIVTTCQAWQISGKPYSHALTLLTKQSRQMDMNDYVHEYYSVERLMVTYTGVFNPMTSKLLWLEVDICYKISKTELRRKPRRLKVEGSSLPMRL
jgi:hypothetical protein